MEISFVFSRSKLRSHKLGCKVIRRMEKTDVSHAAILVKTAFGSMVYEAVFPRVRKMKFEDWIEQYEPIRVYPFEVPKEFRFLVGMDLRKMEGIPYPISQLILIGIGIVAPGLAKWLKPIVLNHDGALICTEVGAILLRNYMEVDFLESLDNVGLRDLETQVILLKKKEALGASIWVSRD